MIHKYVMQTYTKFFTRNRAAAIVEVQKSVSQRRLDRIDFSQVPSRDIGPFTLN